MIFSLFNVKRQFFKPPINNTIMNKKYFLIIFIVSTFILNFAWENLHFPLYAGNNIGINSYWLLMIYASFIDLVYILSAYFLIALTSKKLNWDLNLINIILFITILIIFSLLTEIRALSTGRWSYNPGMPVIFGLGVSPLVQLAVTGILAFFIARKISSKL